MDLGLKGKRALVTGSSSGLGAAIAQVLAAEGAEVLLHGPAFDPPTAVAEQIRTAGGTVAGEIVARLDEPEDVERLAQEALALGPVDILINSAGSVPKPGEWFDKTMEDWHWQFQFSTFYPVQLAKALAPAMRDRGWGRILNVSSGAAYKGSSLNPDYGASKSALHSVTASLSAALQGTGVTVNSVVLGIILTENTLKVVQDLGAMHGFEETGDALVLRVSREIWGATGAPVPPEQIGQSVAFLVSEPAAPVTGAALRIENGIMNWIA